MPAALQALPLASALLDERLHVLAVNAPLRELVGPTALAADKAAFSELLILPDEDAIEADDEDVPTALPLQARLKALAAGRSASFPLVVRTAAGERQDVRAHAGRLDAAALPFADAPTAAYLIQLEPEAEPDAGRTATSAQPLAWYRALFLESVLPKLLLDERHRVVDANDAALEFTGYGLEQLLWIDPATLLADDASRARLTRERGQDDVIDDPVREAMAYPLRFADGHVERIDAIVARPATSLATDALRVATLLPRVEDDDSGSEEGARWRERFIASVRDEQRMLPTASIGAALVRDGCIVRMTAGFAQFFELAPGAELPLERLAGRKTALALEEAAASLDDTVRNPYARMPVVEFVWTSTSGRPASFVAMARRTAGMDASSDEDDAADAALLLTVVDTSGRDADVAARLQQLAASRDALLRQVHHQVGNNLDGLAALVRAEARWHPHAADLLERVAARLRVAAHIEGLQPQEYGKSPQPIAQLVGGIAAALRGHFEAPVEFVATQAPAAPSRWVVRNERLALALACNELITNAIKHRADAAGAVRVTVEVLDREVRIQVRNAGALASATRSGPVDAPAGAPSQASPLAEGGDQGSRPPQGVTMLRRLLPAEGARFSLEQLDGEVVGSIVLEPPVIY